MDEVKTSIGKKGKTQVQRSGEKKERKTLREKTQGRGHNTGHQTLGAESIR